MRRAPSSWSPTMAEPHHHNAPPWPDDVPAPFLPDPDVPEGPVPDDPTRPFLPDLDPPADGRCPGTFGTGRRCRRRRRHDVWRTHGDAAQPRSFEHDPMRRTAQPAPCDVISNGLPVSAIVLTLREVGRGCAAADSPRRRIHDTDQLTVDETMAALASSRHGPAERLRTSDVADGTITVAKLGGPRPTRWRNHLPPTSRVGRVRARAGVAVGRRREDRRPSHRPRHHRRRPEALT